MANERVRRGSGGKKKWGRNKKKCERYRAEGRREKNKARRMARAERRKNRNNCIEIDTDVSEAITYGQAHKVFGSAELARS